MKKIVKGWDDMEENLIDLMVEYLCTDHTEKELREIVEKAIVMSKGQVIR